MTMNRRSGGQRPRPTVFSAYIIEHVRASGASQPAIDETARQMRMFKEMYDKPLMNAAITFVEPFPIGLVVTVISAAVLRKKER